MLFKLVRKGENNRREYPPMHISPVESNLLPDEHSQLKDPRLFLQAPFTHGLLSHSSISIIQTKDTVKTTVCFCKILCSINASVDDALPKLPRVFVLLHPLSMTFKRYNDRQVAHILKVLIKWLFSIKIIISSNLDYKVFQHQL